MKRNLLSIAILAMLMFASAVGYAQTTYTKITSASGLEVGAQYIIVGYDEALGDCAMSYQKSNNRHAVSVTDDGGSITVTPATDPNSQTEVFQFTLGGSDNAWTFFDELKNGYLYAASSTGNQLKTQTNNDANGEWKIEFNSDGTAEVTAQGENTRNIMRFNENSSNGTPLFSCYNSNSSINVPVSFYKAGSAAEPDPEPTNYPTNFEASSDKNEIVLTWTDATGGQLPSKYLIVGSKGSITVPTDGVPVADGELVKNVAYGVQMVSFSNLEGNTTYHFAIFPYTNGGANIDYKTSSGYPTAEAQTEDVHVLLSEPFNDGLGEFTTYNVYGEQEWHHATYSNNGYAYMNGYANGAAHQNEDWLISPVLNGDFATINLSFRTAKNFDGEDLRLMVSSDYDGTSEPSDYEWTELTDLFDWSTSSYAWVESGEYDIKSSVGSRFYIAFVYNCTDDGAAAWEVDDVVVIANTPLSVGEQMDKSFKVNPNPTRGAIHFDLNQQAQVHVFDLSGRIVSETRMSAGASSLDVAALENGIYFLSVTYADGDKEVARFVKF